MGAECERDKDEVKTRLGYGNGHLCVVAERCCREGSSPKTIKLWYPVREAEESEARGLLGRPVAELDGKEGIYLDEEGTAFQLAERGETKPILVEEGASHGEELEQLLAASLKDEKSSPKIRTHALRRATNKRRKDAREPTASAKPDCDQSTAESSAPKSLDTPVWNQAATREATRLNLRQKLAEVRRRIGWS